MSALISLADCALRQAAHLPGHDGEATTLLARSRSFDGCVQRQRPEASLILLNI